jgi:uncharacterized protein (DUF427 family)
MMVKARRNASLIGSSDDIAIVEGNHHFPEDAIDAAVLRPSSTMTVCPWKGTAHSRSLVIEDAENQR